MPTHASLNARKRFAASAAVVDAFQSIDDDNMSRPEYDRAVALRSYLLDTVDDPRHVGGNEEALDGYLLRQADSLDLHIKDAQGRGHPTLEAKLLNIQSRYRDLSCEKCAIFAICHGGVQDDGNVSGRGECIREVKQAFAWAKSLADGLYDTLVLAPPLSSRLRCQLSTTVDEDEELAAQTTFETGGAFESEIEIALPTSLGTGDLARVPYMIAHEIVSHGFYGVASASPRQPRDWNDDWSESWMDCVAHSWTVRDLMVRGSASLPFAGRQQLLDETETAHRARYALDACPGPLGNVLRGARQRFNALLSRVHHFQGGPTADRLLEAFLGLNAEGHLSDGVLGSIVALAGHSVSACRSSSEALTPEESALIGALLGYQLTGDRLKLAEELPD